MRSAGILDEKEVGMKEWLKREGERVRTRKGGTENKPRERVEDDRGNTQNERGKESMGNVATSPFPISHSINIPHHYTITSPQPPTTIP